MRRIEQADLLVVGSPVVDRALYGPLQALFDLVDHRALTGESLLLTATGGSLEHSLVIEHQLRPLFGFFGALTVPTGLYAQPADIKEGEIAAPGFTAARRAGRRRSCIALHPCFSACRACECPLSP